MMESILKEACDAHGLRAIGVNMFDAKTGHITVYIHSGESECYSGTGKNFDEALSCAVAEMKEQHDNAAEAAWIAQQETLMESGGPDDSTYRRDMINAGRGHLLGGA
ncbi:MAG: hypothetical protein M9944_12725 [Rhizobiaceae bacterium]|nr:hypothetical protein [Rhizobiaceae bacterium]